MIKIKKHVKAVIMLILLGICSDGKQVAESQPPNVIFVVCDGLNDIAVTGAGYPQASMPHLKALSERGVKFTNAFTNAPIRAPSRGRFLTGMTVK